MLNLYLNYKYQMDIRNNLFVQLKIDMFQIDILNKMLILSLMNIDQLDIVYNYSFL